MQRSRKLEARTTVVLPLDVLVRIFDILENIRDFHALSSTCRLLQEISTNSARLCYVKESLSFGKLPASTGSVRLSALDALSRLQEHERAWQTPNQAAYHSISSAFNFSPSSCCDLVLSGQYLYVGGWDSTRGGTEFILQRMHLVDGHTDLRWFCHRTITGLENDSGGLIPQYIVDESQDLLVCIVLHMLAPERNAAQVGFWCYSLSTREPHPKRGASTTNVCTLPMGPVDVSLCGPQLVLSHPINEKSSNHTIMVTVIDWQSGEVAFVPAACPPSDFHYGPTAGFSMSLSHVRHVSPGVLFTFSMAPRKSNMNLVDLSRSTILPFELPPLCDSCAYVGTSIATSNRPHVYRDYSEDPRIIEGRLIVLALKTRLAQSNTTVSSLFVVDIKALLQYSQNGYLGPLSQDSTIPFEQWSSHVATKLITLPPDFQRRRLAHFVTIGLRLVAVTREPNVDGNVWIYDFSAYNASAQSTAPDASSPISDEHPHFVKLPGMKSLPCMRSRSMTVPSDPSFAPSVFVDTNKFVVLQRTLVEVFRLY